MLGLWFVDDFRPVLMNLYVISADLHLVLGAGVNPSRRRLTQLFLPSTTIKRIKYSLSVDLPLCYTPVIQMGQFSG